jgi:hypothetical protein
MAFLLLKYVIHAFYFGLILSFTATDKGPVSVVQWPAKVLFDSYDSIDCSLDIISDGWLLVTGLPNLGADCIIALI